MKDFIDLSDLKILFPDNASSLKFLEKLRWGKKPQCPHCGSDRVTSFKNENRHHCNACNVSFSATVKTIFHNTRIPLQKWFKAIALVLHSEKKVSVRKLALVINVNKNTAWQMLNKINESITHTGQKLSDELRLEEFVLDVEKQLSIPLESFKKLVLNMMGTQE